MSGEVEYLYIYMYFESKKPSGLLMKLTQKM